MFVNIMHQLKILKVGEPKQELQHFYPLQDPHTHNPTLGGSL